MAEARARREEDELRARAGLRRNIAEAPETVVAHDRIRWGPIWAGIVTALATLLVLSAIGVAFGFATRSVTTLTAARSIGIGLGIWTAISAIIALFLGGFIAARFMPLDTRGVGMVHGVAVWAMTQLLGTILALLSISVTLGVLGSAAAAQGGVVIGPSQLSAASNLIASSSGWFILWSLLALGAAVLGGYLGMANNQANRRPLP